MWGILELANITRLFLSCCLSIFLGHAHNNQSIQQPQLQEITDTMDRALDRSLDDILEDRKQVCLERPCCGFPCRSAPATSQRWRGRMPWSADTDGCRTPAATATEVLEAVAVVATNPITPEMASERCVRSCPCQSRSTPCLRSGCIVAEIRRRATTRQVD